MEIAGGGDGADSCSAELAEHAEYPRHVVDERTGEWLRHELPMHGIEECCESIPEAWGEGSPAHEVHSDSRRAHCLRVDVTDTNDDHKRSAGAMLKHQRATEHLHPTGHLHRSRTRHQGGAEVGSIQGAVWDGDTLWGEGLLGCSGCVTAAAQRVLREVEDLHQSDALMHHEVCWPHPELTDVCASASLSSVVLHECIRCFLNEMKWNCAKAACDCAVVPFERMWMLLRS